MGTCRALEGRHGSRAQPPLVGQCQHHPWRAGPQGTAPWHLCPHCRFAGTQKPCSSRPREQGSWRQSRAPLGENVSRAACQGASSLILWMQTAVLGLGVAEQAHWRKATGSSVRTEGTQGASGLHSIEALRDSSPGNARPQRCTVAAPCHGHQTAEPEWLWAPGDQGKWAAGFSRQRCCLGRL